MSHTIELADEELAALEELLDQELQARQVELRRTHNIEYKDRVRHDIEVLQRLSRALRAGAAV